MESIENVEDKEIKDIKEIKKENKYIISFPHLGNYYIPVYNFLNNILDKNLCEVMIPKKMSNKTVEYGEKSSPDFICAPFKYNMGNFLESLENGANVLIQAGGGCRYGYYAEVQEKILKDMGYNFDYIVLFNSEGIDIKNLYAKFKQYNSKLKFSYFVYRFLFTLKLVNILDKFETYLRDNITYAIDKKEFKNLHTNFLNDMKIIKNEKELKDFKRKYFSKLKNIKLIEDSDRKNIIKIGIVGELYTSMEPFSSFFIEQELIDMGVKIKRYATAAYLSIGKTLNEKRLIKKASNYISYALGADGTESIAHTLELIDDNYDGIIHIKPFGCTPEINAMPILQKISEEKQIPIIYFTFDMQSSEVGIKTRLEAFYDMLKMKKEKEMENKE